MDLSLGQKLRMAHRFMAAYDARVIQAFGLASDRLADEDFVVKSWRPAYNQPPPKSTNSEWMHRWFWDYLPLHSVRGWWQRGDDAQAPGTVHVVIEHVVDTAIEEWRRQKRPGMPDPMMFESLGPADTLWRALWLHNGGKNKIPDALWDNDWPTIAEVICGGPLAKAVRYARPSDGLVQGTLDGLSVGAFAVSFDELPTAEDFSKRVVARMIERVPKQSEIHG